MRPRIPIGPSGWRTAGTRHRKVSPRPGRCWAPESVYRVVLTGGPGAGKTAVIEVLRTKGYEAAEDAARSIIRARKAAGLAPRPGPRVFAQQILKKEIENYRRVMRSPAFFERGVADAAGLLFGAGTLDDQDADRMIKRYRYDQVFLFPPWEEIYCVDDERDHTFDHAVRVYESTSAWYRRHGYELIEVPLGTPDARADFVLTRVNVT